MATLASKVSNANWLLSGIRLNSLFRSSICKRYIATSSTHRLRQTASTAHLSYVPADKYQRTTITEDVQRAAGHSNWDDPRSAQNLNKDNPNQSVTDPTIRHFTVNFVCTADCLSVNNILRDLSILLPMVSLDLFLNWMAKKWFVQIRI